MLIKKIKDDPMMLKEALEEDIKDTRKVGKRKNWVGGGRDGVWLLILTLGKSKTSNMSLFENICKDMHRTYSE